MWPRSSHGLGHHGLGHHVGAGTAQCAPLVCAPDRTPSSLGLGPRVPGSVRCVPSPPHGARATARVHAASTRTASAGGPEASGRGPGRAELIPSPQLCPLVPLLSADGTVTKRPRQQAALHGGREVPREGTGRGEGCRPQRGAHLRPRFFSPETPAAAAGAAAPSLVWKTTAEQA